MPAALLPTKRPWPSVAFLWTQRRARQAEVGELELGQRGSAPGSLVSKPRGAATADRARLASSSAAASKRALVAAAAAVSRQIQPSQDAQTHGFGSAIPRGGPLTALPALAASAFIGRYTVSLFILRMKPLVRIELQHSNIGKLLSSTA